MRKRLGSGRNVLGNELQTGSIGAENGVGADVWDVGPPLSVQNCELRNLKGTVPEELDRFDRLDLVRVAGSGPAIRLGLPKPN